MSISVGKRIGEALILGVYLVVDALDVWPKSHIGCLVLAFAGVLGILLIDGIFGNTFPLKRMAILSSIALAVCVLVYFIAPNFTDPQSPKARTYNGGPGIPFENTEVRGVLKPANEPTPPNGCDKSPAHAPNAIKALIGNNAITHNGYGSFTAIEIGDCAALSMERRPDGVFVNASLFDRENNAVVVIHDNKITALNGEKYSARQSRDESRLTIRNAKGVELFYVRFLNPTTIQFRGLLGCSGNAVFLIREKAPTPGATMNNACFENPRVGIQIDKR